MSRSSLQDKYTPPIILQGLVKGAGKCVVDNCCNSSETGAFMIQFPGNKKLRREWVKSLKLEQHRLNNSASICDGHFDGTMWEDTQLDGTRKLKRNPIPVRVVRTRRTLRAKRRYYFEDDSDQESGNEIKSGTNSCDSNDSSVEIQLGNDKEKMPVPLNSAQLRLYNPFSSVQTPSPPPPQNTYPIHQDVKFTKLPFYDCVAEVLKPSSLIPSHSFVNENNFYFGLTPQQIQDIIGSRTLKTNFIYEFEKQVQLRFCLSETICEQEDYFPPNLSVKVNKRVCSLPALIPTNKPGVEPKRPSKPVDITPYVKLTSTKQNNITVSWTDDLGPGFTVSVHLVQKLAASDLVKRLRDKGVMNPDYTRSLIKEKLNESDAEIVTTCLRVSLLCPLGKMRMTTPCRATTCQHLQCFDASLFIQMNEKKPTWACPVCDKPALYSNLIIDGYFKDVLSSPSLPSDVNEIELNKDGSWSLHNKNKTNSSSSYNSNSNFASSSATINLDDTIEIIGDDPEPTPTTAPPPTSSIPSTTAPPSRVNKAKDMQPIEIVDLVISDSDDDEVVKKPEYTVTDGVISLDSPSPPPPPASGSVSSSSSSSPSSSSSTTSSASSHSSRSNTPVFKRDIKDSQAEQNLKRLDFSDNEPSSSVYERPAKIIKTSEGLAYVPPEKYCDTVAIDEKIRSELEKSEVAEEPYDEPCSSTTEMGNLRHHVTQSLATVYESSTSKVHEISDNSSRSSTSSNCSSQKTYLPFMNNLCDFLENAKQNEISSSTFDDEPDLKDMN